MKHKYEAVILSALHEFTDTNNGFLRSRVWADMQTFLHTEESSIMDQLREIDPIKDPIGCARLQGRLQQVHRDLEIPSDIVKELETIKEIENV